MFVEELSRVAEEAPVVDLETRDSASEDLLHWHASGLCSGDS